MEIRARRHAALGDPARLAIVDELMVSDRSPIELRQMLHLESNLLAHHLDVLERVGMVIRSKSSGDGRRRYVHLVRPSEPPLTSPPRRAGKALFVCTRNSARSQLAAALWRSMTGAGADSAGTHPASSVHPGAVAAAQRAGLDLGTSVTKPLSAIRKIPRLVVTVCDQAHEELDAGNAWLHWSVPDPVADGRRIAFDHVLAELRNRIGLLAATPRGTE